MNNFKKIFNSAKLSTLLFYSSILTFIIAFNFAHNPSGGWTQQFMPYLNNRPIVDITFTDSLTGYAIASNRNSDTSFVIKTSNGGDNWNIILSEYRIYESIVFLDNEVGYVGGSDLKIGHTYLIKTTNGGMNWIRLNSPNSLRIFDMAVLNQDTIWVTDPNGFDGGIFRTTNGGTNWTRQTAPGGSTEKIYMYNRNIGFASSTSRLYKTTNSGLNWNLIPGQNAFRDIYFIDSLNGWKSYDSMKITTDGGFTWKPQLIKSPGIPLFSTIATFSKISNDTIWATGLVYEFPNLQVRSVIHRTTNGGRDWYFQIPDTSIRVGVFRTNFINTITGWNYGNSSGLYTNTGGDSIFNPITSINEFSIIENPSFYKLFQNFPNPFNPKTKISFELQKAGNVKLTVYDIQGKYIEVLVNEKKQTGNYEVEFDGSNLSSGVYFYRLEISGKENYSDTKRMVLLK